MSNPGVIVLNQNTKREQGKKAQLGNIAAAKAVAGGGGGAQHAHRVLQPAADTSDGKLSEANFFVDTTAAR